MTPEDFQDLLAQVRQQRAENSRIEAKTARGGLPKRLWETLSAFSNTAGGGVLLLGLEEERGFEPVEDLDVARLQADLAALCGQMVPPLRLLIETFRVEGRNVLVAEVPELSYDQKPCYYSGGGLSSGAFIRVGDGDRKLSSYEVQSLLEARGQPRYDLEPVPGSSLADLSQDLLGPFLGRVRRRPGTRFRDWSDERILQALKVLVSDPDGRLVVSLAGWTCFAEYPQERFPSLCVTFLSYPTPSPGELGPSGERFLDEGKAEGPLPDLVVETLGIAKKNMKKRGIVHGLYREELWDYPEEVLREALVNALGHRDLSPAARGAQVQVLMFPDRLEVVSPGGLFGPVSVDQLGTVGVQSSRNEFLMRLLEDLVPAGQTGVLCENRGSGLAFICESLRRAGMSPPEFDVSLTRFRLVFPNHTLFDQETLAWLERVGRNRILHERQRQALAWLRHGKELNNAAYCRVTGADSRVATRELAELVDLGLLLREGSRRWATYSLAQEPVAEGRETSTPLVRKRSLERGAEILALLEREGPLSTMEIAERLRLSRSAVGIWLRRLEGSQRVEPTERSRRSPNLRYRCLDLE